MKQICYKFPTSNIISLLTMKYKKKKTKSGCISTEYFFNISLRSNVFITQCYHWFSWPCASFLNDSQQEKKFASKQFFLSHFYGFTSNSPLKGQEKKDTHLTLNDQLISSCSAQFREKKDKNPLNQIIIKCDGKASPSSVLFPWVKQNFF